MVKNVQNLEGKVFGKLQVISQDVVNSEKYGKSYWFCQCSCGSEPISVRSDTLVGGLKTDCGCERKKKSLKKTIRRLQGSVWGNLIYVRFVRKENTNNYILVRCTCGNQEVVNEKFLKDITECSICRKKHKVDKEAHNFIDIANRRFGKLVAIKKIDGDKWLCKCDCGNLYEARSSLLRRGITIGCSKCNRKHKRHSRFIDLQDKVFGLLHVDSFYEFKNGHTYWKCTCSCSKHTEVIVDGDKLRRGCTTSCGCRFVYHKGSEVEHELYDFLNQQGISIELHNHKLLDGKEIDIYLPDFKIGIEYNGSVFHASLGNVYRDKPKFYHRDKFLLAKSKGIHLINIFDVDWENNQDRIKMYLLSLTSGKKHLYARNCICTLISKNDSNLFTDKYHIQGHTIFNSINYGLFYEGELVSVMSFGRLRLAKYKEGHYELHRYCVKDGYIISGGANKLLKAFEREYNPKCLISYSNNDYFLGGIYSKLNFIEIGQCTPRYYWYLNGIELKREQCKIKNLDSTLVNEAKANNAPNIEDYVMLSQGAKKVWRSGNTKWVKNYSN